MALPINQQNALPVPAGGVIPIGPVVPGTAAADLGKAEDDPHVSGDVGIEALAVRHDAGGPLAADGDYIPLTTDAAGALRVTGGGGGTQYAEGAAAAPGDVGNVALGIVDDGTVAVPAVGDYTPPRLAPVQGGLLVAGYDGANGIYATLPLGDTFAGGGVLVSGSVAVTAMPVTVVQPEILRVYASFTLAGQASTSLDVSNSKSFSLQVHGAAAAATAWDVAIIATLMPGPGHEFAILHHLTVDGDKAIKFAILGPIFKIYIQCVSVTIGPAVSLECAAFASVF
jgi:hypothetical protein